MKRSLAILLLLCGCATPGTYQSQSLFDGTREVSVDPGWLPNGSMPTLSMGAFWNDKMGDEIVFKVHSMTGGQMKRLRINIDGEFIEAPSIDQLSSIGYGGIYNPVYTTHRFKGSRKIVEKMVSGKRVVVRVDCADKFFEGIFSSDAPTTARPAFKKFLARVKAAQAGVPIVEPKPMKAGKQ